MFELWLFGHASLPRGKYVRPDCELDGLSLPVFASSKAAKPESSRSCSSVSSSSIPSLAASACWTADRCVPAPARTTSDVAAASTTAKTRNRLMNPPCLRQEPLLPRCESGILTGCCGAARQSPEAGGGDAEAPPPRAFDLAELEVGRVGPA